MWSRKLKLSEICASARSTARSAGLKAEEAAGGAESPMSAQLGEGLLEHREGRGERRTQLVQVHLVDLTGPLVHPGLLELQREYAAHLRVALVHEPRQRAALERDVLAYVERVALHDVGGELLTEGVDE